MKAEIKLTSAGIMLYEKQNLKRLMRQVGAEIAAVTRAMIRRSQGGGRTYYLHGARYQASAPGNPPGNRTGALIRGVVVRPFRSGEGVAIRDRMFYALFLEVGAKGGGGRRKGGGSTRNRKGKPQTSRVLAPRPFLSLALESRRASIDARVKAAVLQGIAFKRQRA